MGPHAIVIHAPRFDDCARLGRAEKPVLVETLVAEPTVEGLDVGILIRLAQVDEMQPDVVRVGPGVDPDLELYVCTAGRMAFSSRMPSRTADARATPSFSQKQPTRSIRKQDFLL